MFTMLQSAFICVCEASATIGVLMKSKHNALTFKNKGKYKQMNINFLNGLQSAYQPKCTHKTKYSITFTLKMLMP